MLKKSLPDVRFLQHGNERNLSDLWRCAPGSKVKHPLQCGEFPVDRSIWETLLHPLFDVGLDVCRGDFGRSHSLENLSWDILLSVWPCPNSSFVDPVICQKIFGKLVKSDFLKADSGKLTLGYLPFTFFEALFSYFLLFAVTGFIIGFSVPKILNPINLVSPIKRPHFLSSFPGSFTFDQHEILASLFRTFSRRFPIMGDIIEINWFVVEHFSSYR